MLPFGLESVTPEMRQRNLHVIAMPSTANHIDANGLSAASSVHRVVLVNTDRTETVQPLHVTTGTVQSNSAFRSVDYTKADAAFAMSMWKEYVPRTRTASSSSLLLATLKQVLQGEVANVQTTVRERKPLSTVNRDALFSEDRQKRAQGSFNTNPNRCS